MPKIPEKGHTIARSSGKPVWEGPNGTGPNGGVTQSMLGRFLSCRERFRLLVIEGLRPRDEWHHRTGYGDMWHVCEEAFAVQAPTRAPTWEHALADHCRDKCRKYPTQGQQIDHWYCVAKTQFPLYIKYWASHQDVIDRVPLLQEQVFDVSYLLPSGRKVRLRGRWDAVDLIGRKGHRGVYLFETKTKGDVNEVLMRRQLTFDLQTMLYLVALQIYQSDVTGYSHKATDLVLSQQWPILGVRYNVVRRPLSGGKGSIVRHKPSKSKPLGETKEAFYARLRDIIAEDPGHYFMRWKVEVGPHDVAKFRRECLDPILEQLCDWWDWVAYEPVHKSNASQYQGWDLRPNPYEGSVDSDGNYLSPRHWRHPFGVFNPLDEGGSSDVDEFLQSGSEIGLSRTENLFPELV